MELQNLSAKKSVLLIKSSSDSVSLQIMRALHLCNEKDKGRAKAGRKEDLTLVLHWTFSKKNGERGTKVIARQSSLTKSLTTLPMWLWTSARNVCLRRRQFLRTKSKVDKTRCSVLPLQGEAMSAVSGWK